MDGHYEGRIFSRSGRYVSTDSWYDAFISEPHGSIKLGNTTIKIIAKVPDDLSDINQEINKAYCLKYVTKHPHLMKGISNKILTEYTMEFILLMQNASSNETVTKSV